MKIENNTLILDNNDINSYITYDTDKSIMFNNLKEQLSKSIKLSSCKKIKIPSNIYFQNIKEEYKSLTDLIDTLHPCGDKLFPYQGFEVNNLSLNQFNDIIEEYLKNNLTINLSCSEDFGSSRTISFNAEISLNGKHVSSESDSFTLSDY